MEKEFDVLCDTILHMTEVQENLELFASELRQRGFAHDRTKLQDPEFSAFVSTRERFKKANYGTPEYEALVKEIKPAIDHHYENNRHHTGFHSDGINGMTFIDILEMLADWKAAARRSPDKELRDTLEYAYKKYKIEPQLAKIIDNTLFEMGWL